MTAKKKAARPSIVKHAPELTSFGGAWFGQARHRDGPEFVIAVDQASPVELAVVGEE